MSEEGALSLLSFCLQDMREKKVPCIWIKMERHKKKQRIDSKYAYFRNKLFNDSKKQ